MSGSNDMTRSNLYTVKGSYLGSEPMGELLEGENGSDVIQIPLKRIIKRTNGLGRECQLSMTNDSLIVSFPSGKQGISSSSSSISSGSSSDISRSNKIKLPIDMLAYCGALRQLPSDKIVNREFETLDKSPANFNTNQNDSSIGNASMNPLFVTIFRSIDNENTLYCHSFVIAKDDEAMELVKLVMEIYYNLIKLQDLDNNLDNDDEYEQQNNENIQQNSKILNDNDLKNFGNINLSESNSSAYLNELLNIYNKTPIIENNFNSNKEKDGNVISVSANEIIKKSLDPNEYKIINEASTVTGKLDANFINYYSSSNDADKMGPSINELIENLNAANVNSNQGNNQNELCTTNVNGNANDDVLTEENLKLLNNDTDPIIIKRANNEKVVYKQNVFIRWLQPPTPPPPAPIIIREVQEPAPEPLPPLVIYKQAPRPQTPPPLVIRERPPSPLAVPTDPLVIERRIALPEQHRKIIIEHLPPPPSKPRDIILEKWLPKEPPQRAIYVQRSTPSKTSSGYYQQQGYFQQQHPQIVYQRPSVYEVIDTAMSPPHKPRRDVYEIVDSRPSLSYNNTGSCSNPKKISTSKSYVRPTVRRSNSNDIIYYPSPTYQQHSAAPPPPPPLPSQQIYSPISSIHPVSDYYSKSGGNTNLSSNSRKQKVAGYRIIRQIIPGPNTSQAEIEKALSRSQRISTTYGTSSTQRKIYSPAYDVISSQAGGSAAPPYHIYSSGSTSIHSVTPPMTLMNGGTPNIGHHHHHHHHHHHPTNSNNSNATYASSLSPYQHGMTKNSINLSTRKNRPIIIQHKQISHHQQPVYSPHNTYKYRDLNKREIYRSSSIDNF